MEISLQVAENSGFNPNITYNNPLSAMQSFNLALGANFNTTATRIDVLNSYYIAGKIAKPGVVERCRKDRPPYGSSSPLLESDLGIENFLRDAATQADLYPSSTPPEAKKDAKVDVFSYQVKFEIISNGSVNPSWKLTKISAETGSMPLLSAGRTRTHYLLLTFGPTVFIDPISGLPVVGAALAARRSGSPSQGAIDAHLAQQIGIAIQSSLSNSR